ncbi:hypothetical protein DXG01_013220 [Tephrocybe rancida]|nr:hypothetical protein DXG01_013220 [Tephrocybe rancida]
MEQYTSYQTAFYSEANIPQLTNLLDLIQTHPKERLRMQDWFGPLAVDRVCEVVLKEMEDAKPLLRMTTGKVTPEFIDSFDVHTIMDLVVRVTPVWTRIVKVAMETKESSEKLKTQRSRNRCSGRNVLSSLAHFLRSRSSAKVQLGFGLMAVSTGVSQVFLSVLNQAGLTLSYASMQKVIKALSCRSLEAACSVAVGLHGLGYDNTSNSMSKVQSGTFSVIYELFNASETHMELAPMMKHLKEATPTNPKPKLQNTPRCRLPPGHKTKFHPLRVSTIKEASIKGNIQVHNDIYLNQLKLKPEDLNKRAIPAMHNQLTNARNRGNQDMRGDDLTPWDHREVFQLAFGIFHLIMNLIWSITNVHRGSLEQLGSLTHLFSILEKAQLGGEHPDFHTLLAALTQILNVPTPPTNLRESESSSESGDDTPKPSTSSGFSDDNIKDTVHENLVRLTRDLLYVTELVCAVADGDIGCVEDILPDLACMFRGAGSNNYSTEILHLLFNLKKYFQHSNIMRDNMIVNPSGIPGHAMGINLNIEHLIGYLKILFTSKGLYANWDRLGDISAAVNHLQWIKNSGSTHTTVNTDELAWRIANKVRDLKLQDVIENCPVPCKLVHDLRLYGRGKFESSSLSTFNKKIHHLIKGKAIKTESDDIPPPAFIFEDTEGVLDEGEVELDE